MLDQKARDKATDDGPRPGHRIWFRQACRGGYGFQRDVPAVLIRRGPKRWMIEVWLSHGTSRKRIYVSPQNVRDRTDWMEWEQP